MTATFPAKCVLSVCVLEVHSSSSWVVSADICTPGPFDSAASCYLQPLLHDKPDHFICFDARVCLTCLALRHLLHATPRLEAASVARPLQVWRFQASCLNIHMNSFRPRRVWEHISQTGLLIVPNYHAGNLRLLSFELVSVLSNKTKLFILPGFSRWDFSAASVNRSDVFSLSPCSVYWRLRFSDLVPHIHLSSQLNLSSVRPSVRTSRLPHPFPPPSSLKASHHFVLFIY